MGVAAGGVSTRDTWGPVSRGFTVWLPNGESGTLRQIRHLGDRVELLVEVGSAGSLVAVDGGDVDTILPRRRRVIIHRAPPRDDASAVEAAGGIIRLPARDSTRLAGDPVA